MLWSLYGYCVDFEVPCKHKKMKYIDKIYGEFELFIQDLTIQLE